MLGRRICAGKVVLKNVGKTFTGLLAMDVKGRGQAQPQQRTTTPLAAIIPFIYCRLRNRPQVRNIF